MNIIIGKISHPSDRGYQLSNTVLIYAFFELFGREISRNDYRARSLLKFREML